MKRTSPDGQPTPCDAGADIVRSAPRRPGARRSPGGSWWRQQHPSGLPAGRDPVRAVRPAREGDNPARLDPPLPVRRRRRGRPHSTTSSSSLAWCTWYGETRPLRGQFVEGGAELAGTGRATIRAPCIPGGVRPAATPACTSSDPPCAGPPTTRPSTRRSARPRTRRMSCPSSGVVPSSVLADPRPATGDQAAVDDRADLDPELERAEHRVRAADQFDERIAALDLAIRPNGRRNAGREDLERRRRSGRARARATTIR